MILRQVAREGDAAKDLAFERMFPAVCEAHYQGAEAPARLKLSAGRTWLAGNVAHGRWTAAVDPPITFNLMNVGAEFSPKMHQSM